MRHAVLETARVGANICRERLQLESQVVDGSKRLFNALLQTPLSIAQRGLVAEIICSLDGWRKGQTTASSSSLEFHVEPPDLSPSDFNCAEVLESALAAVRKNADEKALKVQTALLGPVPQALHGNAQQIHQLITLLAASLPAVVRAENLEIRVSVEPKQTVATEMEISLLLSSNEPAGALCLRLKAFNDSCCTVRTAQCTGQELALASAWQLALALGSTPLIHATSDQSVRLQITLPLTACASPSSSVRDH